MQSIFSLASRREKTLSTEGGSPRWWTKNVLDWALLSNDMG
jgi:hypothetical protein